MTALSNLIANVVSSLSKVRIDFSVKRLSSNKSIISLLNQCRVYHRVPPLDRSF